MMPVLTFVAFTSTPGMTAPAASLTVPPTVALLWAYATTERQTTTATRRMGFCPITLLSSVSSGFLSLSQICVGLYTPECGTARNNWRGSDLPFFERGLFLQILVLIRQTSRDAVDLISNRARSGLGDVRGRRD